MMIRFATLCDAELVGRPGVCGARSPEYTGWPTCEHCGGDTCPEHEVAGSRTEADGRIRVLCLDCDEFFRSAE